MTSMANLFIFQDQKIKIGDLIQVHFGEGNLFEGILMAINNSGENQSITVRRIGSQGIGIEKIFPTRSPLLKKITVKKTGKVRRAKIYYLRKQTKKELKKIVR